MIHLPYGGSTAARTLACPAWHKLSEGIPKTKAGKAADLGNLLHDAMEIHVKEDKPFDQMVGQLSYEGITLTEDHVTEFLEPAAKQLDTVLEQFDIDEIMVEPFVQYTPGLIGGSIDLIGASKDRKTVLIADYKFGRGRVDPDSPQLPFYACCAADDSSTAHLFDGATDLVFCIIQPALSDTPKIHTSDFQALGDFWVEYMDAVNNPTRASAGDHCKFCPAAPVCPTKKAQALSALSLSPKTAQEISDALHLADDLADWITQVRAQAFALLESGNVLPDHKLVAGRSMRRWSEGAETVLHQELGEAAFERKLLGLAKIEKMLGKERVAELGITVKPEGKPTLVPREAPGDEILNLIPNNLIKKVAQHKK